jgi:hypothetical protein
VNPYASALARELAGYDTGLPPEPGRHIILVRDPDPGRVPPAVHLASGHVMVIDAKAGDGSAGLVQWLPSGAMTLRLSSSPPQPPPGPSVSGTGYARGGLVSSPGLLPSALGTGTGFDRGGQLDDAGEDDPDLVLGAVTGYRWWTLPEPDYDLDPGKADRIWPAELLKGQWDTWHPGVNTAVCHPDGGCTPHDPAETPKKDGGCGYWAYWLPQPHNLSRNRTMPVFGVVRGSGKILLGEDGFRAGRARLLAVHLPFSLAVKAAEYRPRQMRQPPDGLSGALARAGFSGKVMSYPSPGYGYYGDPADDLELDVRDVTREQDPEGYDLAEAWLAVIGDRLRQTYPGVEVCETRDLLMAKYPPDENYAPQVRQCVKCGQLYPVRAGLRHSLGCVPPGGFPLA